MEQMHEWTSVRVIYLGAGLCCCTGLTVCVIDVNLSVQGYLIQCALQGGCREGAWFSVEFVESKRNKTAFVAGLSLLAASAGEATRAPQCADAAVEAGMVANIFFIIL